MRFNNFIYDFYVFRYCCPSILKSWRFLKWFTFYEILLSFFSHTHFIILFTFFCKCCRVWKKHQPFTEIISEEFQNQLSLLVTKSLHPYKQARFKISNNYCLMDLDRDIELIILQSILTTFEAMIIFWLYWKLIWAQNLTTNSKFSLPKMVKYTVLRIPFNS